MTALGAWLAGPFFQAVWPNLAASVLWVPVAVAGSAAVHHFQLRHHRGHLMRDFHAALAQHHPAVTYSVSHPPPEAGV